MNWGLPKTAVVGGREYDIRTDFRCILDIITALADPELDDQERAYVALTIFYPDFEKIPSTDYQEAIKECFRFINGGKEDDDKRKPPRLVAWDQDFPHIVAPINRVIGQDVRGLEYYHWWTFLAAYMEIGDCTFAQIVRIRNKLAKGEPLDKSDRKWYRENRQLVDIKKTYTAAEQDVLKGWGAL